eukprot:Clim_evm18s221 gene=Clim_evmTU18s221
MVLRSVTAWLLVTIVVVTGSSSSMTERYAGDTVRRRQADTGSLCGTLPYATTVTDLDSANTQAQSLYDEFDGALRHSTQCQSDDYSIVQTCDDCREAYRNWLCVQIFPPDLTTEQPPCLSQCYEVVRSCPRFLLFECPRSEFIEDMGSNAEYSMDDTTCTQLT